MAPKGNKKGGKSGGKKSPKSAGKPTPKSLPPPKRAAACPSTHNDTTTSTPPHPKTSKMDVQTLPTPIKSKVDDNSYKVIRLPNGIRALLVHCPVEGEICTHSSPKKPTAKKFSFTDPSHVISEHNDLNLYHMPMSPIISKPSQVDSLIGYCTGGGDTPDAADQIFALLEAVHAKKEPVNLKASIAVTYGSGATSDYNYRPGLAHFCEHMVHYGSEKYKEEEGFQSYILKKGSATNAATSACSTEYFFTVYEDHLREGLDRLSSMLGKPSFDKDVIRREVHAVDNENMLRIHRDILTYYLIIWSTAKTGHPLNTFPCGNLETLLPKSDASGVESLRNDLKNYHKSHYVGSNMTIALQSSDSLEDLEKMIIDYFSQIPKGDKSIRRETVVPSQHKNPYETPKFNNLFIISGKQSTSRLCIAWALSPSIWKDFKTKSLQFWGNLIEDEGEHGFVFQLRKEGLISDLGASVPNTDYHLNEYLTMFEVTIHLTPHCLEKYGTLLQLISNMLERVFIFLGKLRRLTLQQKTLAWSQFASTKNRQFEYTRDSNGADFVCNCADALQNFPEEQIFSAKKVLLEYQDDVITSSLKLLTPSAMNVSLTIPDEVIKQKYLSELRSKYQPEVEKWSKTKYWTKAFPKELLARLGQNLCGGGSAITIPRNPFSSTCNAAYAIASSDKTLCESKRCKIIRVANSGNNIWAYCTVVVVPSGYLLRFNQHNSCKLYLLEACFRLMVVGISNSMMNAGMGVHFWEDKGTLQFVFYGLQDKLPLAIETVMGHIFPREGENFLSRPIFDVAKGLLLGSLKDTFGEENFLTSQLFYELFITDCPSFRDCIRTISQITFENLTNFSKLFGNSSFVYSRMEGNVSDATANEISAVIQRLHFHPNVPGWETSLLILKPQVTSFPHTSRCIRVKSDHRSGQNSLISNFYQIQPSRAMDVVPIVKFLGMYMRSPFFQLLRTKQQLGYDLGLHFFIDNENLRYIIEAHVKFPRHKNQLCKVDEKIDAFFVEFEEKYLRKLEEQEFHQQKRLWGIDSSLKLMYLKHFYNVYFLQHLTKAECGRVIWNAEPGRIRKFSIQVLGGENERCGGFKNTECIKCPSLWVKPSGEEDQPVHFAKDRDVQSEDDDDMEGEYFIDDIQEFKG